MICCDCCGFDDFFDAKHAAKEMRRYRRKGPIRSTALLVEALRTAGVEDATILDIGGGIGAIQHQLLGSGAASAVDVDGSQAYLDVARAEAERSGHADRIRFVRGDFVDLAGTIDAADVVTLDRVICCYPDMPTLVDLSADRARRLYGLVFPREHLLMRVARPIINTWSRLKRSPMRFFLHGPREVDRRVRERGLSPVARARTLLWNVVVYRRS
jgi:magnesium-protoporphyrin O-methyltransferase